MFHEVIGPLSLFSHEISVVLASLVILVFADVRIFYSLLSIVGRSLHRGPAITPLTQVTLASVDT